MSATTKKTNFNEARRFLTPKFKILYPNLFTPRAYQNKGPKKYDCEMLFDKETTSLDLFNKAVTAAIVDRWGKDKTQWPEGLRRPIIDGDKPKKNKKTGVMEVKPEYKGMWVIKASCPEERKLLVVDKNNQDIEVKSDIYGGAFCRAQIWASTYENDLMAGITFKLDAVQKLADGKRIGGVSAEKVFGPMASHEDESFDSMESADEELEESFI